MDSKNSLDMGWTVWDSKPGDGGICCTYQVPPWGPPTLKYCRHGVIHGSKRPGRRVDHQFSVEDKERVDLYFYYNFCTFMVGYWANFTFNFTVTVTVIVTVTVTVTFTLPLALPLTLNLTLTLRPLLKRK